MLVACGVADRCGLAEDALVGEDGSVVLVALPCLDRRDLVVPLEAGPWMTCHLVHIEAGKILPILATDDLHGLAAVVRVLVHRGTPAWRHGHGGDVVILQASPRDIREVH